MRAKRKQKTGGGKAAGQGIEEQDDESKSRKAENKGERERAKYQNIDRKNRRMEGE
jgi:hypothetical protein